MRSQSSCLVPVERPGRGELAGDVREARAHRRVVGPLGREVRDGRERCEVGLGRRHALFFAGAERDRLVGEGRERRGLVVHDRDHDRAGLARGFGRRRAGRKARGPTGRWRRRGNREGPGARRRRLRSRVRPRRGDLRSTRVSKRYLAVRGGMVGGCRGRMHVITARGGLARRRAASAATATRLRASCAPMAPGASPGLLEHARAGRIDDGAIHWRAPPRSRR